MGDRTRQLRLKAEEAGKGVWESIPVEYKVWTVILAILLAGFTAGMFIMRFGLEAQVVRHDVAIDSLRVTTAENRDALIVMRDGQGYLICERRRAREEAVAEAQGRQSIWTINCEDAYQDAVRDALQDLRR